MKTLMYLLKHWLDVVAFFALEAGYLIHYLPRTNLFKKDSELYVCEQFWKTLVPVSQSSLTASMIALSILLPSTIGLIYYLLQKTDEERQFVRDAGSSFSYYLLQRAGEIKKTDEKRQFVRDAVTSFSFAFVVFLFSLFSGIVVMGFMPVILKMNMNITLDWTILCWATAHYSSFALGVVKLFRGWLYVRKIF